MRGLRIIPKGKSVSFSVNTRTAQKKLWLGEHDFREELYKIIIFWARVFYVDIHALIIMENHWHGDFTLNRPTLDKADLRRRWELSHSQTPYGDPWREDEEDYYFNRYTNFSEFMKVVNERSAWLHNKMYNTAGHLWGSRFHSDVVESDESMLRVLSYIELNAMRANIEADPTKYEFNTVSKIDQALRNNAPSPVVIPAVGRFAKVHEKCRALVYVMWIKIEAGVPLNDGAFHEGGMTIVGTARAADTCVVDAGVSYLELGPDQWLLLVHGHQAVAEEERVDEQGGWNAAKKQPRPPD